MTLVRKVVLVALVFLPACGGCSAGSSSDKEAPAVSVTSEPSNPLRFMRSRDIHRRHWDGGVKRASGVASDAAIE